MRASNGRSLVDRKAVIFKNDRPTLSRFVVVVDVVRAFPSRLICEKAEEWRAGDVQKDISLSSRGEESLTAAPPVKVRHYFFPPRFERTHNNLRERRIILSLLSRILQTRVETNKTVIFSLIYIWACATITV